MFKIHSFFPFFNHFLSFTMLMFAAGASSLGSEVAGAPIIDAAGDGGGEGEHQEGTVTEGEGEGDESTAGAAGAGEGDETDPDAAGATARTAIKAKPGMTPEIAKALDAIKITNPKVAAEIKAKIYAGQQAEKSLIGLKKDFPGGVTDVLKLKQAIDTQLGGPDGLQKIGAEIKEFRAIDQKWLKKDPSLVANLAAEYPDEFSTMVPHFINKYAEVAPDAYSKMYSNMVIQELKENNVPHALYLLNDHLASAAELGAEQGKMFIAKAAAILANINKWVNDLNTMAAKAIPPKEAKPDAAAAAQRNTEADLRETKQFNREVLFDYGTFRDSLITKDLDQLLKDRKKELTPERRDVVVERALKQLSIKMNADEDFRKTVAAYEKAKDREGLVKFLKSRAGAALKGENGKAGLVAKAYEVITGEATLGTKKKDAAGAPGTKGAPVAGWTKLAKPPVTSEISRRLTTAEGEKLGLSYEDMIMKNKYVLHDGRKVFHD